MSDNGIGIPPENLTRVFAPESISGRELAHTLIMEKPDLKVIFTSGYSAELFGSDFEREKEHVFLAKPYLPDRLAQTVATHLQSQPAVNPPENGVVGPAPGHNGQPTGGELVEML